MPVRSHRPLQATGLTVAYPRPAGKNAKIAKERPLPNMFATEWLVQWLGVAVMAVLPIVVETNDGNKIRGKLSGFTADALLLDQAGKPMTVPFLDLSSMRPTEAEARAQPQMQIELTNGSRIHAQDLKLDDDGVLIEPRRQDSLLAPVHKVRAIRFRRPSSNTDAKWLGLVNAERRGDMLVIRRPGNKLDPQQGIILAINSITVVFDLDGTKIDAPIDQLEGLVFGGNTAVDETPPIRVTDIYGSSWAIQGISPNQATQPIKVQLDDQLEHAIPLDQIARIDWSSGISMLAMEKPVKSTFKSYLPTQLDPSLLNRFFGPQTDKETDLIMNGGSMIAFRIDPNYQTLAGTVQRNNPNGTASKLTVNLKLDGKVVWTQSLPDAAARGFEIDVNEARQVVLEVDSGSDGDVGDSVRFSRPRLLK